MNLQNIWRRVVGGVLIKMSLANVFPTRISIGRFQHDCQAAFGLMVDSIIPNPNPCSTSLYGHGGFVAI